MENNSMMFGDPSLSSSQLRMKAYEILCNSSRPLAACEIESWIRNNDSYLWDKISTKCKDYIRIILSQTRGDKITKFKCVKPPSDVDRRANFFGISGRKYNSGEWIPVSEERNKVEKKKTIDPPYVAEKPTEKKKKIILPSLPSWIIDSNSWIFKTIPVFLPPANQPITVFNFQ